MHESPFARRSAFTPEQFSETPPPPQVHQAMWALSWSFNFKKAAGLSACSHSSGLCSTRFHYVLLAARQFTVYAKWNSRGGSLLGSPIVCPRRPHAGAALMEIAQRSSRFCSSCWKPCDVARSVVMDPGASTGTRSVLWFGLALSYP